MSDAYAVSHLGLCVGDLDRSLRFYCEGLGFAPVISYEIGDEAAATLEVPTPVRLTSQMIAKGALVIELLCYASPGATGTPSAHRNQLGLTHLSFTVEDVDAAAARLVEYGGTLLADTRTSMKTDLGSAELVFLADPDGTRVELMKLG
ncbi:VOC family protein [Yinghuangia seranimata]|uniref:VOC family protein n=1 Tax=Yinghuangia seranimata TaxID=408067 RepID=UPI00248AACB5|nr:VOC family protein [Yinghuangia seranimata]MDI2130227.1 VOC family protein [Yinghuangia seranimata]